MNIIARFTNDVGLEIKGRVYETTPQLDLEDEIDLNRKMSLKTAVSAKQGIEIFFARLLGLENVGAPRSNYPTFMHNGDLLTSGIGTGAEKGAFQDKTSIRLPGGIKTEGVD